MAECPICHGEKVLVRADGDYVRAQIWYMSASVSDMRGAVIYLRPMSLDIVRRQPAFVVSWSGKSVSSTML